MRAVSARFKIQSYLILVVPFSRSYFLIDFSGCRCCPSLDFLLGAHADFFVWHQVAFLSLLARSLFCSDFPRQFLSTGVKDFSQHRIFCRRRCSSYTYYRASKVRAGEISSQFFSSSFFLSVVAAHALHSASRAPADFPFGSRRRLFLSSCSFSGSPLALRFLLIAPGLAPAPVFP
jgi:hypothetical protein